MPIEKAAAELDAAFRKVVEERGTPSTHSHGEIVDDEWNREHFVYASTLARATGLDFVQIAAVEMEQGNYGVSKIIEALPTGEPPGDEARRLRSIHRLGSGLYEVESKSFLASLADPELTEQAQRGRYLDAFVEAWALRTTAMPDHGFPQGAYPLASRAAVATGLAYEKLATIEYKGGKIGLKRTLERIPGLPDVDLG
jgi:hypothetical protein